MFSYSYKLTEFKKPYRYKGIHGGRGSGKSWFFARRCVEAMRVGKKIISIRETQKSLDKSSKQLMIDTINRAELSSEFKIYTNKIIHLDTCGEVIFMGMQDHTADSIKSVEAYDIAWMEEAQNISQYSIDILIPTIRKEGSEIWACWNRVKRNDPIEKLFYPEKEDPDILVTKLNYYDNPFIPDVLIKEKDRMKRNYPEKYAHVWCGEYQDQTESRVFNNFTDEKFESPKGIRYLFGADWGFGQDPTTLIRGFLNDDRTKLFIDYESYEYKIDLQRLPSTWESDVPLAKNGIIYADSSRPDTIKYMKSHGFSVVGAKKGAGSIQDGIDFLSGLEIIIHPRCKNTLVEFNNYSYKKNRNGEILNDLEDKHNHAIDAIRYMLEKNKTKKTLLIAGGA